MTNPTSGTGGRVSVENRERLALSAHPASSFSRIFSGCLGLASISHDLDTLASLTRLLRQGELEGGRNWL